MSKLDLDLGGVQNKDSVQEKKEISKSSSEKTRKSKKKKNVFLKNIQKKIRKLKNNDKKTEQKKRPKLEKIEENKTKQVDQRKSLKEDLGLEKMQTGIFFAEPLKPQTLERTAKKSNHKRFIWTFVCFILLFTVVMFKVATLELTHTFKGENLNDYALEQTTKTKTEEATRGIIYDANGEPLSINVKKYKLVAVLNKNHKKSTSNGFEEDYIKDPNKAAKKIIEILGYQDNVEAKKVITEQLQEDPSKTYQVEFGKYGQNLSLEQKEKLEEADLGGLAFEATTERYYPYGEFGSYLIGYTYTDEDGNLVGGPEIGIEYQEDNYLQATNGEYTIQEDKKGIPNSNTKKEVKKKRNGTDVQLTLDSSVQSFVYDSMKESLKGQDFDRATTVVMDKDGAILAGESFPTFDPNTREAEDYNDPYFTTCFEPGSTIKTFLVASAIEDGSWNPEKVTQSGIRRDERWGKNDSGANYIADWLYNQSKEDWGRIGLAQSFYISSNTGMTYVLDDLGYDTWQDYMENKYLFGEPITSQGNIFKTSSCDYSPNYDFETATTAFGQGMTANVAQMLRGYSLFLNDGDMINPYLIKSMKDSETGEEIYNGKTTVPKNWKVGEDNVELDKKTGQVHKKVLSSETVKQTNKLMEGVMYYDDGNVRGTGYAYGQATKNKIAGKTGTSQVVVDGSYNNDNGIYSAMILVPAADPQFIIYTTVNNPSTSYPNTYMQKYLSTIADNTLDYLKKENTNIDNVAEDTNYTVPDFIGKNDAEVKEISSKTRVENLKIGSGKVTRQYPQGGAVISTDSEVILTGENIGLGDLKKLSKDDLLNFCSMSEKSCQIDGFGDKVVDVTLADDKYKIKLK